MIPIMADGVMGAALGGAAVQGDSAGLAVEEAAAVALAAGFRRIISIFFLL